MTLKTKKFTKKKISKMKRLYDVINEEIEKPKRKNSMTPLRPHSQTIDSKTTRDSSIKNSRLLKQSSEKNINKLKDTNNNKTEKGEKIEDKNKLSNTNNDQKNEEELKIDENTNKNAMKFEDFLNKIITDNYLNDNRTLIYHFCQQCFCFLKIEKMFNQISNTYENIKKNNIDSSDEKLNKLIEFTNVLVVEMLYYYIGDNIIYDYILKPTNFYYKLISYLIMNLPNKKEENNIKPFQLDSKENDNGNNTINEINSSKENYIINKKTLINMNINIEKHNEKMKFLNKGEKLIKKSNTIKLKNSEIILFKGFNNINKDIEELNEEEKDKLRKTTKYLSSNKRKVDVEIKEEVIKEEKDEDGNTINFIYENEEKKSKENKKNNIIEYIMKKAKFSKNILSSKEEQLDQVKNIIFIFDKMKEKELIDKYLKDIKNDLKFYKELQKIKDKEKGDFTLFTQKKKRLTRNYTYFNFINNNNTLKKKDSRDFLNKGYFCVIDWKIEEIGKQLMIISKSLLNRIYPRELYKAKYVKKDKDITSPNVINCIKKFNRLTSFIMQDILSYNTPKDRAKIYEKWVDIAEYCRINKDYNDLIAIYSAFNHYIITGLTLTLKEVKTKTNSILNKIKNFCSVEGNYLKIRKEMDDCIKNGETFIPYLGMLLRDITFFEEKSKYINEKGIIYFDKIEKISEMFEVFFKFKEKEENKNNIINIKELEFFNDLEDITEEELEKIANNIEPEYKFKEVKKTKKRLTKIDIKYFEKYKGKGDEERKDSVISFNK